MKNRFYSHILSIDPVHEKLEAAGLSEEEKKELVELLHSHIHITVIDIVLSDLDEEKKKEFLHILVVKGDNSTAWKFIKTHIGDIESKLVNSINKIIDEFVKDLD